MQNLERHFGGHIYYQNQLVHKLVLTIRVKTYVHGMDTFKHFGGLQNEGFNSETCGAKSFYFKREFLHHREHKPSPL
jgi:hypothetical protein